MTIFLTPRWICYFILLYLCNIVTCGDKLGHVESLSLKESVIRNTNGVMVMTLSPRKKTVLALKNDNLSGVVTDVDGQKTRRFAKPAIIFAKSLPKAKSEDKDAPLENQTATEKTESNAASGSGSGISGAHHREETHDDFTSSEDNAHAVDFENENESLLLSQSALRNASIDRSSKLKTSKVGQVWSSNEETTKYAEENEFQTLIAGFLKREIWTIPLFVFSSLNLALIAFFEIYVLCKTSGQSRGHLFLGQMLLLGLFLCSTLSLLFAVYPTTLLCFVFRIGIGLSYSLVFSVLLVKCILLQCMDVGFYLPTMYQGCLLFFAVLVQLVLDTQFTVLFPPIFQAMETTREDSVFLQCGTSYSLMLYSMWYIAFLILLVAFLAAKATFRGVSENYRESIYILMSIIVSIPISISWILAGWILEGRQQDACVAFGLVAQTLTIFLIMFLPKGRQLAAMGKDMAYDEDDMISRYSPSFFHFKPSNKNCKAAMFGDGNVYTTLEPTLSTINPNVFFHRSDNRYHSGMIY